MHSDVGGAGEHEETSVRIDPVKSLPGSPGHVVAVQVVHLVVADLLSVEIVIEPAVILRAVGKSRQLVAELTHADALSFTGASVPVFVLSLRKFTRHLFCFGEPLSGIEDGGLVHVVPEPLDALICQETVFAAEPFPGVCVEHIREMRVSRPDGCHEIASVLSLAEIAVLHAFLVNIIAIFYLDTCVDDGYKADMLILHLLYKSGKIIAEFFIQCKVLVRIHIIDIHVDHIQWNVILTVSRCDFPEIFLCLIPPAALPEAECKFRRDIAPADDMAELFYNIVRRFTVDDIQVQICVFTGNCQRIHPRVPDVESQCGGIVEEQPEGLLPRDHDKVMCSIERTLVLGVVRVVGAVADIAVSPFVDAAVCLSEAVDDIVLVHDICKRKAVLCEYLTVRGGAGFLRKAGDYSFCVIRCAIDVFSDHNKSSFDFNLGSFLAS